jgi:hypothetical protein
VVRPRTGGDSPELGCGGELRGLRWDFYRREREGWWPGHELLGKV